MLAKVAERQMHWVRWGLTIGWFLLIMSLFFDPVSSQFTAPDHPWSPMRLDPSQCILVQGECLPEQSYALGAPIFWGLIVPSAIFILLVFGHEFWRRICPLSFISQIPRAMGWERKNKRENKKTGKVRYELVKVKKDSWLAKNHLPLQLGLFYVGLNCRILFVNSNRWALGSFLLFTIAAALTVGFLYGGKSWCQYFCPMAPVQQIYAEPRGLLASTAHEGDRQTISQSMCRTVSPEGKEMTACVACNSPCIDIDAERSYWQKLTDPQQQWLYYGYVGVVVGYFLFYFLYSGSWDYYLSGTWSHDETQLNTLLKPGLYLFNQAIPIPKIVAAPIVLAAFGFAGYGIGRQIESRYKVYQRKKHRPLSSEEVRHRVFSVSTFFVFNFFFLFAGRNYIDLLPAPLPYLFPTLIAVCSTLWLYRTWQRSNNRYNRESLAGRLRKQLRKLNLDTAQFLEGKSLDELNADEIYVLAKVLPGFSKEKRLQTYKSIMRESIEEGYVAVDQVLEGLQQMRKELDISEKEHEQILDELMAENPELFRSDRLNSREDSLRLESFRETFLETVLESWKDHPEESHIQELAQVFQKHGSPEDLKKLMAYLSKSDQNMVAYLRQEYGISDDDEMIALRRTEPDELWQVIALNIDVINTLVSDSTESENSALRKLFSEIDTDGSGGIDIDELKTYIKNITPDFTDDQIEMMFNRADIIGNNMITYEEFCVLFKKIGQQRIALK
ncbi:EF hand repeat-containing protein [[Leptolyngbya] sp. PCC 7376]|uniref:EF-hand domain-containing protein n=1 Tax=[Leptolyngbya] sp. PCC 7376 TaxID=111781 RepID=UPI00029EFCAA|nr:EF-hand domain-containing protein [[Leptolyngbya] sp. PCC 7376]AFY37740.1 EF hand repeat-containing protein [[Leptolyngbya] sp. PCC 7376]